MTNLFTLLTVLGGRRKLVLELVCDSGLDFEYIHFLTVTVMFITAW
jgi:hypothetical protein